MNQIKDNIRSVKAFAPATCANVAVGFDILGFAFHGIGDHVTLTRREDNQIKIESIDAKDSLPHDTQKNTASVVIQKICDELNIQTGFSIQIKKGIPLSSGMGGSAASAVAALVAFNKFLETPLSLNQLAEYALFGEEVASGQKHADNIVPCLFGGMTLVHSIDPMEVIQLPVPNIYCVLIHPHLFVSTKEARKILKAELPLKDYIKQSANLAGFISSLYQKDISLLQKTLNDILIEPQRAQFVPGFHQVKKVAIREGALGVSFSGSGPSIFAFAKNKYQAGVIGNLMQLELKNHDIESDYWISRISNQAAEVKEVI